MALSLPYSLPRFSFFHKNPPISPQLYPTPTLKTSIDLLKFPVIRCSTKPNNPITLNPRKDSKTQSGSALNRPLQAADAGAISTTGTPTEAYATGRHISMSANKVRRAIDQIRGRSYEESLMILELMPYRACYPILKLVYSAAANASHNLGFNKASLVISKAEVNEGTTRKRIRPQSRGRAHPIRKRTCHITVAVKEAD